MTASLLPSDDCVICFAAHPDDETIGAGGQFPLLRNAWIVHATDGAPRNMLDAHAHGFTSREAYADARRQELGAALQLAGIDSERALALGFADQECAHQLAGLTRRVGALLREMQPHTVLVPPYEGGHPDHDSLAFAIHLACRDLANQSRCVPKVVEYALYHGQFGRLTTNEFLARAAEDAITVPLSELVANLKRQMLQCFATQSAALAAFSTEYERFRPAPRYNFAEPPHAGTLYYERFDWGIDGSVWRARAVEAARELEAAIS